MIKTAPISSNYFDESPQKIYNQNDFSGVKKMVSILQKQLFSLLEPNEINNGYLRASKRSNQNANRKKV